MKKASTYFAPKLEMHTLRQSAHFKTLSMYLVPTATSIVTNCFAIYHIAKKKLTMSILEAQFLTQDN